MPGRRHRERVEQPALSRSAWPTAPVFDRQVLLHRALRVDRDREQAGRARPPRTLACVVEAADAVLAASSATIVRSAARARRAAERDRDGRLADAALAGDEDQAASEQRAWHSGTNIAAGRGSSGAL